MIMTESQCKLAQVQNEIYRSTSLGRAKVKLRLNRTRKLNVFEILSASVFSDFLSRIIQLHSNGASLYMRDVGGGSRFTIVASCNVFHTN